MNEAIIIFWMVAGWICLVSAVIYDLRPDPRSNFDLWEEELND